MRSRVTCENLRAQSPTYINNTTDIQNTWYITHFLHKPATHTTSTIADVTGLRGALVPRLCSFCPAAPDAGDRRIPCRPEARRSTDSDDGVDTAVSVGCKWGAVGSGRDGDVRPAPVCIGYAIDQVNKNLLRCWSLEIGDLL